MIARAIVLVAGMLVYLAFVQYGRQVAGSELSQIQDLYTTATGAYVASSTAYASETPGSSQLDAKPLSN
jgi:hypothetical protein